MPVVIYVMKGTAGENLYDSSWNNLIPFADESSPLAGTNLDFCKGTGALHEMDPNVETFFRSVIHLGVDVLQN